MAQGCNDSSGRQCFLIMHILISAVSRFESPTGICRHAANLAQVLEARPEIRRISFATGTWQKGYYRDGLGLADSEKIKLLPISIGNNSLDRNLWFMRELPRLSKAIAADIVHLSFPVPITGRSFSCKSVVTVHDLYPYDIPENFGFPQVLLNRKFLRMAVTNADAIACVSQTTLCRLCELFPKAQYKAAKIFNVVQPWRGIPRALEGLRFRCFVLTVAQHRQNKNLLLAVEGFEHLRQRGIVPRDSGLVIVGSSGPATESLKQAIAERRLQNSVQMASAISEGELRWLYENCLLFMATSRTEGFCLPLVEAMFAGCRIVCSDIPIFREIGSSECAYFELKQSPVEGLLSAARKVCEHASRQHQTRAIEFSPEAIGAQYSELYCKLVGRSSQEKIVECH
jgi:glycosyltransferase involved in cell wall biosynthesis